MARMDLQRTPLLIEQQPVPVDWPTRSGYPPPGVTRKLAHPAGRLVKIVHDRKRKKRKAQVEAKRAKAPLAPAFDAEYDCSPEGKKIAKSHAWMFPSKRVKNCGKILKY